MSDAQYREDDRMLLADTMGLICHFDEARQYDKRNVNVWRAMHVAKRLGLSAGVRIDPDGPEWPVVYIELPAGQVSWHVPQHDRPWDGHSTDEKYRRTSAFTKEVYGV